MKKDKLNKNDPKIAAGLDDNDELEQEATNEEIEKGEFTPVYTFSYDEVEPS